MPVSLALLAAAGVMIACGIYLVLERTLSRIVLGFVLAGNGVNLLFIVAAGPAGLPPFEGTAAPEEMTDPLPFAMVLTAIVISLGITAFGVALAYRAWQLFGHDEVPDDVEDRRVLRRARRRPGGEDTEAPAWSRPLTEEVRRGALLRSQGLTDVDPHESLGADLSGAEDVPQDPTEADEGGPEGDDEIGPDADTVAERAGERSARERATGALTAQPDQDRDPHGALPGSGPMTDADHDRDESEEDR